MPADLKLPKVTDPLFGITYLPDRISFEPLPQDAYRACSELTNQRWDRKMWIFAKSATPSGDLLVIGGFFVAKTGKPPEIMADTKGVVLRWKGSDCRMLGPAEDLFDAPPPEIPASDLQLLAQDAACRYTRAFGDRQKLLGAFKKAKVNPAASPAALKKAILSPTGSCK